MNGSEHALFESFIDILFHGKVKGKGSCLGIDFATFTKQILFHLAVSVVIAYLASRTLSAGAAYLSVFRIVGTTAILGYTAAIFPAAIWYHEPRNYVTGKVVDGLVWGLLTAGSFAGFWPA